MELLLVKIFIERYIYLCSLVSLYISQKWTIHWTASIANYMSHMLRYDFLLTFFLISTIALLLQYPWTFAWWHILKIFSWHFNFQNSNFKIIITDRMTSSSDRMCLPAMTNINSGNIWKLDWERPGEQGDCKVKSMSRL